MAELVPNFTRRGSPTGCPAYYRQHLTLLPSRRNDLTNKKIFWNCPQHCGWPYRAMDGPGRLRNQFVFDRPSHPLHWLGKNQHLGHFVRMRLIGPKETLIICRLGGFCPIAFFHKSCHTWHNAIYPAQQSTIPGICRNRSSSAYPPAAVLAGPDRPESHRGGCRWPAARPGRAGAAPPRP